MVKMAVKSIKRIMQDIKLHYISCQDSIRVVQIAKVNSFKLRISSPIDISLVVNYESIHVNYALHSD